MSQARRRGHGPSHGARIALLALLGAIAGAGCSPEAATSAATVAADEPPLPGEGEDAGRTVIYRDTWGIPHIYAPTVEAGFYAMGYAQAQDRPSQLLLNLKIAMGELAEVAGESQVPQDLIARLFDHYGMAERQWPDTSGKIRNRLTAFADGINAFYQAHPEDVPPWWGQRAVTPQMVSAFGRMFLYNWSIDEALNDLRRGGVEPGFVSPRRTEGSSPEAAAAPAGAGESTVGRTLRASNQWAVAPQRSASGEALLLIDPHLSWWGVSRFWEVRMHVGQSAGLHGSSGGTARQSAGLHGSGVTLAGNPYIGLGHNEHVAWAMTTGGPDTGDVFTLTLNPEDPGQYRYDGKWRDLDQKTVTLGVKGGGEQQFDLAWSHLGPVVATAGDTAYAARIPYDEAANPMEVWEALNFATDYRGAVAAGETLAMFPQNLMAADTSGNIYYQRSGRVPVRPEGYDFSRPVDGSTPASDWQGIHPADDHLQVLNPPQGYMQNCNIPPEAMIVNGPFSLSAQPDYLFSSANYGPALDGWINQRGARALELLHGDESVTMEEALAYAVDVKPYGISRWLTALDRAVAEDSPQRPAARALLGWDGQLERDSAPALTYGYWRFTLSEHPQGAAIREAIDDHYAIVEGRAPAPVSLDEAQLEVLASTFADARQRLETELGTPEAPWGRVFRVGRDGVSWPVGGGSDSTGWPSRPAGGDPQYGLTTLRTMGYDEANDRGERWGMRGQTSTQVVELSTPIRSWIYLPVGQSDRPGSPHYTDQAEQVFSERRLKPSWWLPEDLAGHIESRTVLEGAP